MFTKIIKTDNQEFHDKPPTFKAIDRKRFFYVEEYFRSMMSAKVRGNDNLVFIVIAYGYFKATGQFYDSAIQEDIDYVAGRFKLTGTFIWSDYRKNTRDRHRELICDAMGYRFFTLETVAPILHLLRNDARAQKNPDKSFVTLCQELFERKIVTPDYKTLVDTVSNVYQSHMQEQISTVSKSLSNSNMQALDELFEKPKGTYDKMEVHRLTLLKKLKQSIKPSQVRINVEAHHILRPLYDIAQPIVDKLDFTQEGLKRFVMSVDRRQIFQTKRLEDADRYLHLIIFIVYQFRQLEDTLIEIFMTAVKHAVNAAEKKAKDEYYKQRKAQSAHTQRLIINTVDLVALIEELKSTLTNPTLSDSEKVECALKLVSPSRLPAESISANINDVQADLDKVSGQALFMRFLEEGSRSLQLKCNDILCLLNFDPETTLTSLYKGIQRFQKKQGEVDATFPIGFLDESEKKYVDEKSGFRKLLYKVLLFRHMSNAVRDGTLNLVDSNRYKRFDQYGISKAQFAKNRDSLLKLADMEDFKDVDDVLQKLELRLDAQFKETNEHILENINEYVEGDGLGGYRLISERNTQAEALSDATLDIALFPENEYIRITEAINTVNSATDFLNEFEHIQHRYLKKRPENRNFYAGILGLGGHFGLPKLAKLSFPKLEAATLESTANGFFSLDNIQRANDAIIRFVNRMPLTRLFENEYGLQTSSDGQKWIMAYDSLNANRSFKYGGKDLVVAAYTFIDARGLFPHSMVISGAAREAHYMIDGLLKNDVVRSDMHSTDTHGYGEAVFGATEFLKFTFAPRLKNPGKRILYSFCKPSIYKRKNYPIVSREKIKPQIIRDYWDDILRVMVSIKLGEVTASQIFKRMNSYSSGKNPVYDALREFGRIIKTLYLLKYADDVDMRKAVHKQLNKGEAGNKLDRALAIGRKEYTQTLKEDQEIAEACKRLLKNIVVCWNFMYVSQRLLQCKDPAAHAQLMAKVRASSMLAWEHFVFHGEYDFSDRMLRDSQNFDFESMMDPSIIKE